MFGRLGTDKKALSTKFGNRVNVEIWDVLFMTELLYVLIMFNNRTKSIWPSNLVKIPRVRDSK